jgi:hypothetical protein
MKYKNLYFLIGQFSMAGGVLFNIYSKGSSTISLVSDFLIGLSLVFNIAFAVSSRKEK